MELDISAGAIFNAISSILIGVIGWMLRSVYLDFKQAVDTMNKHEVRLSVMETQITHLRADIDDHVHLCRETQ